MKWDGRWLFALTPLLVAVVSCEDVSPTVTKSTTSARSIRSTSTGTTSQMSQFDGGNFGTATGNNAGVSGLLNQTPDNFGAAVEQGALKATVITTVASVPPGQWKADEVWRNGLEVRLAPRKKDSVVIKGLLGPEGQVTFANLPEGSYHYIYDDGWKKGGSQAKTVEDQGMSHIEMIGFFVSRPIEAYQANMKNGIGTSLDLYWDTQSFPRPQTLYDSRVTIDEKHSNSQFYTYEDQFRFKAWPGPAARYRVVVYSNDGYYRILWKSAWHKPDDVTGEVMVDWNGYEGSNADEPNEKPETRVDDNQDYLWCIWFKEAAMDDLAGRLEKEIRSYERDPSKSVSCFYGATRFMPFHLMTGKKPSPTPKPASPVPSPSPSIYAGPSVPPLPIWSP